jgi:hypothetical protein
VTADGREVFRARLTLTTKADKQKAQWQIRFVITSLVILRQVKLISQLFS